MTFASLSSSLWVTQHAPFATNSGVWLAPGRGAASAQLIDPGIAPDDLDAIARFVAGRGAVVEALVLTHAHWDHLLGPERFPGVPVIAHARYREVVQAHGADLARQVAAWAAGAGVRRARAFVPPQPETTVEAALALPLGDLRLELRHAPGHAPDHLVIYEASEGVLWAGDMLSDLEPPMVMDSLAAYERTLAELAALDVRALVPGHGTPTTDPAEIRARFARDRGYLAALRSCVTRALARGATLAQTCAACEPLARRVPGGYADAHRWNVGSAYVELGGEAEPPVGWDHDWIVAG